MSSPPPKPPVPTTAPQQVAPEVITQFLAAQQRQFEIREKEIELQRIAAETERQKVENTREYALKALDAQVADRKDQRQDHATTTRYGFRITMVIVIGILSLAGYALFANKDQVIIEVLKVLAYGGGGGGFGFAIGFRKGQKEGSPNVPPAA